MEELRGSSTHLGATGRNSQMSLEVLDVLHHPTAVHDGELEAFRTLQLRLESIRLLSIWYEYSNVRVVVAFSVGVGHCITSRTRV